MKKIILHIDDINKSVRGEKLEVSKENQELYFIRDYLGNIKSIFDNNGNMLYYRLYDEFGNEGDSGQAAQVSLNLGAAQTPAFGFTSREFDEITDLYFYRSRYYDPTLGRFTQRDKFNEAGFITGNPAVIYNPLQLNDYTYVGNNPLIYTDPWGMLGGKDINYYTVNYGVTEISLGISFFVTGVYTCNYVGVIWGAESLGQGIADFIGGLYGNEPITGAFILQDLIVKPMHDAYFDFWYKIWWGESYFKNDKC